MTDQPDTSYGDEPAEDDGVLEPSDSLDGDDLTADVLDTGRRRGRGLPGGEPLRHHRRGRAAGREPGPAARRGGAGARRGRRVDRRGQPARRRPHVRPAVRSPRRTGRGSARGRGVRRRRVRRRHRRWRSGCRGGSRAPARGGRRGLTCEPQVPRSRPCCIPTRSPVVPGTTSSACPEPGVAAWGNDGRSASLGPGTDSLRRRSPRCAERERRRGRAATAAHHS